jgi:hypothetical protein
MNSIYVGNSVDILRRTCSVGTSIKPNLKYTLVPFPVLLYILLLRCTGSRIDGTKLTGRCLNVESGNQE